MSLFGMRGAWQGQERLTDEAHRAIHQAETLGAARGLRQTPPDLLLLALVAEADSVAARALDATGADRDALRQALDAGVRSRGPAHLGRQPLDADAREVVILGINEARRDGFERAGAGHLLLGVIEARAGKGARLLAKQGVDLKTLRWVVHNLEQAGADGGSGLFAMAFSELLERTGGAQPCPRCHSVTHISFHYCYHCGASLRPPF